MKFRILLILGFYISVSSTAQLYADRDSLLNELSASNNQSKSELLHYTSLAFVTYNADSAAYFAKQNLLLSKYNNFKNGIATAYSDLCISYKYKGEHDKGISYGDSAILLIGENYPALKAATFNSQGVCYEFLGQPEKALELYHQSLKIYRSLNSEKDVATTLNNIGVLHQRQKQFHQAVDYLRKSNVIQTKIGNLKGVSETLNNIAIIFARQGELDSGLFYFTQAFKIQKQYDDISGMSTTINNLGLIYSNLGNEDSAIAKSEAGIALARKAGNIQGEAFALTTLGQHYWYFSKPRKAIPILKKAIKLAHKSSSRRDKRFAMENLQWAYKMTGDYESAYNYYTKFKDLADSINSEAQQKRIDELEIKFQTNEKQRELEIKNLELKSKEATLKANKIQIIALLFGLLSAIIGGLLYYQWFKRRKETQLQKAIIDEKENGLKAVITATEEERKRIAKDLHDGVGQELSGLKLSLSNYFAKDTTKNKSIEERLLSILDEACFDVRTISHQMMPKVLLEKGLIEAIEDMLHKSFDGSEISYNYEHFAISHRFKEHIEIGVYRICQELINNIIKHSNAKHVDVQISKSKDYLLLLVTDDGKGFDKFEKGEGIGLTNLRSRSKNLRGNIDFETEKGKGTTAKIRIPLS